MRHLQSKGWRVWASVLAGALGFLGVTYIPSTFATTPSGIGTPVPGAMVTNVTEAVDPETPLFYMRLNVQITGLDCSSALPGANGQRTIELNVYLAPQRNPNGKTAGDLSSRFVICDADGGAPLGPVTSEDVLVPVLSDRTWKGSLWPNEPIYVYASVRYGDGGNNDDFTLWSHINPDGSWTDTSGLDHDGTCVDPCRPWLITTPPVPVWVGVGDGYTSAVDETVSSCSLATPIPSACYAPNTPDAAYPWRNGLDDRTYSWVYRAVQSLNTKIGISDWAIQYVNVASEATYARDLTYVPNGNGTTPQLAVMQTALRAHPGSWNFVGVTAGLRDAGVIDAMTAFFTKYAPTSNSLNPWDVTKLADCPFTLANIDVVGRINAASAAVRAGLQATDNAALDADPNVRIVHPLYPYWAEATPQTINGYQSPCRPQIQAAVDAIDTVVSMAGMANVSEFDLRPALDPHPTGDVVTTTAPWKRSGSPIQLNKPYGFPYLSATGATSTADDAVEALLPDLSITNVPDAPSVSAGSPVAFTVTLADNGPGDSPSTTLTDALPKVVVAVDGSGNKTYASWSIDGQSGPGDCSVIGVAGSQSLQCGTSGLGGGGTPTFALQEGNPQTVHLTADTSGSSCGAVTDTAAYTATFTGTGTTGITIGGSASASVFVICDVGSSVATSTMTSAQKVTLSNVAMPTGFGTPTGTVTFKLFNNNACTGTPLYDSGAVPLVGGVARTDNAPNGKPSTLTANGTYYWLLTYSGDANNLPATTPCGTEQASIAGNTSGLAN